MKQVFNFYRWLVLSLVACFCLVPLWATVIGGFKTTGDLRTNALGLPKHWVGDNYISIVATARFWQMLWKYAVIATFTLTLTLLVSSLAAYTLAPLVFAGRNWISDY